MKEMRDTWLVVNKSNPTHPQMKETLREALKLARFNEANLKYDEITVKDGIVFFRIRQVRNCPIEITQFDPEDIVIILCYWMEGRPLPDIYNSNSDLAVIIRNTVIREGWAEELKAY